MKRDLTEVGWASPYRHGSETVGSLNNKNLNSEIETAVLGRFVDRLWYSLNNKNLNSEIETQLLDFYPFAIFHSQ